MRLAVGLGAFLIVAALSGATYQWLATRKDLASAPPPGRFIDVGGYRLHLWCMGAGAPTVILESGLGGTSAGWGFVQPEVARFTRVCSYDRAGTALLSQRGSMTGYLPRPTEALRAKAEAGGSIGRWRIIYGMELP
jgi:hypothetical protein